MSDAVEDLTGYDNSSPTDAITKSLSEAFPRFSPARYAFVGFANSSLTYPQDILDAERFWNEELLHANETTNVFGVGLPLHDTTRRGDTSIVYVRGLIDRHAYSVLRVKECRGKRFVVIRNPWGCFEWTGPWSDGSKEWTPEWYGVLKELDHKLGDDGEFVMECE